MLLFFKKLARKYPAAVNCHASLGEMLLLQPSKIVKRTVYIVCTEKVRLFTDIIVPKLVSTICLALRMATICLGLVCLFEAVGLRTV